MKVKNSVPAGTQYHLNEQRSSQRSLYVVYIWIRPHVSGLNSTLIRIQSPNFFWTMPFLEFGSQKPGFWALDPYPESANMDTNDWSKHCLVAHNRPIPHKTTLNAAVFSTVVLT